MYSSTWGNTWEWCSSGNSTGNYTSFVYPSFVITNNTKSRPIKRKSPDDFVPPDDEVKALDEFLDSYKVKEIA